MWSEQIHQIENRLDRIEERLSSLEAKFDQIIAIFSPASTGKFMPIGYFFAGVSISIAGIIFIIENIIKAIRG